MVLGGGFAPSRDHPARTGGSTSLRPSPSHPWPVSTVAVPLKRVSFALRGSCCPLLWHALLQSCSCPDAPGAFCLQPGLSQEHGGLPPAGSSPYGSGSKGCPCSLHSGAVAEARVHHRSCLGPDALQPLFSPAPRPTTSPPLSHFPESLTKVTASSEMLLPKAGQRCQEASALLGITVKSVCVQAGTRVAFCMGSGAKSLRAVSVWTQLSPLLPCAAGGGDGGHLLLSGRSIAEPKAASSSSAGLQQPPLRQSRSWTGASYSPPREVRAGILGPRPVP